MAVAKRKPNYVTVTPEEKGKAPAEPKKWNAFSVNDSKALEAAFQTTLEDEENAERSRLGREGRSDSLGVEEQRSDGKPNRSIEATTSNDKHPVKVPVNEDYLFDVDVKSRELGPAYWLGPIYEVRRGTWFDGSSLKPVEENLAVQLEEGFLRTQPWKNAPPDSRSASRIRSESGSRDQTSETTVRNDVEQSDNATRETGSSSAKVKSSKISHVVSKSKDNIIVPPPPLLTHRLFGPYMNRVATYQDSSTAWILSDDFLSRMSSSMFQRFGGGQGTKYVRGYTEPPKKKPPKDGKRPTTPTTSTHKDREGRTAQAVPENHAEDDFNSRQASSNRGDVEQGTPSEAEGAALERGTSIERLERQMSSLVQSASPEDPEKQEEEARQREQREIENDYREVSGEQQDREVEHLILVTHGIGQRLGARFETFNFIHDVNELRKTLKAVYGAAPDLQALNSEMDSEQKNCRVQVLPICWRHMLDFPHQGVRHNRQENDIADMSLHEEEEYPNLQAITVDGVPALRNIVADLALDVLLYQTPAYKEHISRIVVKECNRIYKLFKSRNPTFEGKISLLGHSLGSAIMFDILCDQKMQRATFDRSQYAENRDMRLDFSVEDFYCFGSPIGLFQMLKGRTIAGRTNPNKVTLDGLPDSLDEPTLEPPHSKLPGHALTEAQRDAMISSPKCRQLFNIFHPTDPIGYRLEPLIAPAMASMKPQALPYTKKNFFGAPMGQGFTGIPAKVGQSFSGMWSNFSSGLASSFINRSLGISAEDAAKLGNPAPPAQGSAASTASRIQQSLGAGTNIVGGGVISSDHVSSEEPSRKRRSTHTSLVDEEMQHPPTLIDSNVETLYSGFQKRRKSEQDGDANLRDLGESPAWVEADERGKRLKKEEAKVRALNTHGRVDYSIQE
ncbi:MAG: hypothetical protein M1828_003084 [Chrysothrix sp. TS-e1954]|nr:MAG: hypothetical protein M1828_003084 [Chrysothrix sp. TS-e1954]